VVRRSDRVADQVTRSLVKRAGRARLVVLGGEVLTTHSLPERGSVVIGRGQGCDVKIDDPSISRRHARLQLGLGMTIEDLGSSNGTEVRGERISGPAQIELDELVTIGSISVVVQQQPAVTQQRTLWGHGYFELRLAEECTRAHRSGTTFGVLRVRADASAVDAISAAVRDVDVIGVYAPNEWEILLVDASSDDVAGVARAVKGAVPRARVATAMFPSEGDSAWTLAAAASAKLGDGGTDDARLVVNPVGPMKPLFALVDRVAIGDISVLILGETGSGKEVIAEQIHQRSRRVGKPLLKLNCAAVPEQLIESELFGHEKGSFTGATSTKPGLLEQATTGSVFIDEVGELPAATQAKLLRVLEQREIMRVGALKPLSIDVRFIAATHRDLEAAIAAGRFREDLYFRLAGVTLQVPPLRDRPDELEPLVQHFAQRAATALGRPTPRVTEAALELLRAYRWPGNVRELRNVIDRATLLCETEIDVAHLPEDRMRASTAARVATGSVPGLDGVRDHANQLERQAIEQALARANGNQTEAAKLLGISRRTLTNKLNHHGFDRPRKGK